MEPAARNGHRCSNARQIAFLTNRLLMDYSRELNIQQIAAGYI